MDKGKMRARANSGHSDAHTHSKVFACYFCRKNRSTNPCFQLLDCFLNKQLLISCMFLYICKLTRLTNASFEALGEASFDQSQTVSNHTPLQHVMTTLHCDALRQPHRLSTRIGPKPPEVFCTSTRVLVL